MAEIIGRGRFGRRGRIRPIEIVATLVAGAAIGFGLPLLDTPEKPVAEAPPPQAVMGPVVHARKVTPRPVASRPAAPAVVAAARRFGFCHTGGGTDCVVDGDTFWIDGEKVRIADIDAPETHPSRCPVEADLGARATMRLQAMLNAGPVTLAAADRDVDRYGRKLRVVMRDGRSLGDALVAEGLALPWDGARHPWC